MSSKRLLHPLFSDGAVLQREKPVTVWGWAVPTTEVSVRLSDENGPRGGEDKRCRIQITFPGAPSVVIDDTEMEITHVIRGDDHVNNTPRQINILAALGATLPQYGHVPMIHGPDGEKLSKRHGAVSVMQYHEDGFLPDAVINYLARLGWSHGDDELFDDAQAKAWLQRLVDEGVLEKQKKPAGYIVKQSSLFE